MLAAGDGALQTVPSDSSDGGSTGVITTGHFVTASLIVMSVAGFLIGIFSGYFFIGFAWSWRHWPGLLAFIVASFIGASLSAPA